MSETAGQLEELVRRLDAMIERARRNGPADAIDAILDGEPRSTAVQSLRDHAVMQQFRDELIDGLIRVDTANKLLRLITLVVERAAGS